ncbi:hypothetical protein N7537_010239 [Penicillium hordei]|uniref:Uncharacterized protein n=1 Tax=Penicillium hordei TaxID=40994 RepID=A0AAD6DV05_9EURO|nr:uncharacterized protein N7537_010239 [Penicillium hordei]KAJ5593335.1 hypothetical protein N7537_010239 [Penicillium hordei]
MDGLPLRLFNYVNFQGQGQSAAAMPYHDDDEMNFSFLLNYPSTNSSHANTRALVLDFEDQNISFQGVAALTLPSSRLDESRSPDEPLIILYMANSAMLPLIENHWGGIENSWRMNRLLRCPLWLYIDLLQACGHWSDVWGVAAHDLAWRNTQAYRETSRSSTLRLTRRLHKATSNVITLRENLRLHISSTEQFREYVEKKQYQPFPMPDDYQTTLSERTGELLQDLRHHWATSDVILEQFKSLMSLVFNTETVAQGQAVARLNLLAFAFLPLSFVTGIFGMTTWTISAIWYPLWAFVALVLLTIATYIVGKILVEDRGGSSWLSRLHWGPAQSPRADVESRSAQKPLESAAIAPTAVVTAKMRPSAMAQTSLQRMGSYGRNQRGSRRAKRQTQLAERDAHAITPPSGQPHRSLRTSHLPSVDLVSSDMVDENSGGEFNTDPDETSATFPPSLPETTTVSDAQPAVEINRLHYDNGEEGSGVKKHVAFQDYRGPRAQVAGKSHGRHQEGLDLAYNPNTETAEMYDTEIRPPVKQRQRRREKSTRQQGTFQQSLDISVHEAEMPRPLEIVPSKPDRTHPQSVDLSTRGVLEDPEERMRPAELVQSASKRYSAYRVGLALVGNTQSDAK